MVIEGSAWLKIVARGKGDNKANRLEHTLLRNLRPRNDYHISFKARWSAGSQTMLTRGFNHDFARSHELDIPRNLGTPGAVNSVTQRQAAAGGSSNIGPVIDKLIQGPNLPGNNTPVEVRCRVQDPDGVESVRLFWNLNRASNTGVASNQVTMQGPDDKGRYHAVIPGQALRRTVVFYVEATDGAGVSRRLPVNAPERTLLYLTEAFASNPLDTHHIILDLDRTSELNSRQLHSNDLLDGTFIFDDKRAVSYTHLTLPTILLV